MEKLAGKACLLSAIEPPMGNRASRHQAEPRGRPATMISTLAGAVRNRPWKVARAVFGAPWFVPPVEATGKRPSESSRSQHLSPQRLGKPLQSSCGASPPAVLPLRKPTARKLGVATGNCRALKPPPSQNCESVAVGRSHKTPKTQRLG